VLGISFGGIARPVLGPVPAVMMSVIVFAGSAQFAATAVLAASGGAIAAVAAGVLLNARFLRMGAALAPWLSGGPLRRVLTGQAVVDASWALAHQGGGRFDPHLLLGATFPQYPAWVGGTVIGVLVGGLIGDPGRLGLDAIFPAFSLALLATELRDAAARWAAVAAGAIGLALVPFTPPGVPVIAASAAALLGLRRR
jgi:predicted branched-subunit amino acid permease